MVITTPSVHLYEEYCKKHKDYNFMIDMLSEMFNPYDAKDYGKLLSSLDAKRFCFNVEVLDYIELDKLYGLTEDLELKPFKEMYAEQLKTMSPGEIMLKLYYEFGVISGRK